MKTQQLKKYIIVPTLKKYAACGDTYKNIYSPQAVKLLLMTAAVESNMGYYLVQNNNKISEGKKAVSIYQMERSTINWLFSKMKKDEIFSKKLCYFGLANDTIYNLRIATIVCRLIYWYKTKTKIPSKDDNNALWKYYKKWYNSSLGDTTRDEFFSLCKKHKVLNL